MKKGIHPNYGPLEIVIGDDVFLTSSSSGQNKILMDVDFRKHPAWTKKGNSQANSFNQNVSTFNKKFGAISFGPKK